jgi:hypothetical protein
LGVIASASGEPTRTTLETSTSRQHDREDDLQAASEKVGGHLFESQIRLIVLAPAERQREASDRIRQMAGAFGAFTKSRLATFRLGPIRRGELRAARVRGFLLSHEELATLWHPPTASVLAEQMQTTEFTELEAPAKFYSGSETGAVVVGQIRFREDRRVIGIAKEDRRRHLYVVGKTGMGKTTLLLNQVQADIAAGRGVCLIDPHGDLAVSLLRLMPKHRTNDVILFDAGDREFAVSFNPLACRDPALIDQVTSGVVSAFKKLHDSWGPRLEDTLRNAVFAIVEHGGTMLELMRLLPRRDQLFHRRTGIQPRRTELARMCRAAVFDSGWRGTGGFGRIRVHQMAGTALQNRGDWKVRWLPCRSSREARRPDDFVIGVEGFQTRRP